MRPEWWAKAACRGKSPKIFMPDYPEIQGRGKYLGPDAALDRMAKAICADCPVKIQCLHYAREMREPAGIWGGENEFDRLRFLRRQQKLRRAAS